MSLLAATGCCSSRREGRPASPFPSPELLLLATAELEAVRGGADSVFIKNKNKKNKENVMVRYGKVMYYIILHHKINALV